MKHLLHSAINQPAVKRYLTTNRAISRLFFEAKYLKHDPYHVQLEDSSKWDRAFSLLDGKRFSEGLEIGCGEGMHTWRLGAICDSVTAIDISAFSISRAKLANSYKNIRYVRSDLIADSIPMEQDLIFCSEVLYYLGRDQLDSAAAKIVSALASGGQLLLIHHRSSNDDEMGLALKAFGAKTIHEHFMKLDSLAVREDVLTDVYRITLFERVI